MSGVKRACIKAIRDLLSRFPCVVVLGARQIGKTTLLRQVYAEAPFFDLERPVDYDRVSYDCEFFLSQWKEPILLDEAQALPELFPALRVVIDQQRDLKGRFLLSGSSSPDLTRSVTESLAGRVAVFDLGGFEMSEMWGEAAQDFYRIAVSGNPKDLLQLEPRISDRELFESCWSGTYPEPFLKRADGRFVNLWQENYFRTYIDRDVRSLFPGLNLQAYRTFIRMLATASGQVINAARLASSLDVAQPTVRKYLQIAEGTFLWRSLPSYQKNIAKRLTKTPRGYLRDPGLLNHMLGIRSPEALRSHAHLGAIWEGFIIEQLLIGFQNRMIAVRPHFYRTHHQAEIDLVLEGEFGILPIEVKVGFRTGKKPLTALDAFIAEQGCPYGIVINNAESAAWLTPKIVQVPASCL